MSAILRNPYVLFNNKLIHIDEYSREMSSKISCPNCKDAMTYVSGTNRCRAHFRHIGISCSDIDYRIKINELLNNYGEYEELLTTKPKIQTVCKVCLRNIEFDFTDYNWTVVDNSIKINDAVFLSFEDHAIPRENQYTVLVSRSNFYTSVCDNLPPCEDCENVLKKFNNEHSKAFKQLKSDEKESFTQLMNMFIEKIDDEVYFKSGPYAICKIADVWECDKAYFLKDDIQAHRWLKNMFKHDYTIFQLIRKQMSFYYECVYATRNVSKSTGAKELRNDLIQETLNTLDQMITFEIDFEDFLTCHFGKHKDSSFYDIPRSYLAWIIMESTYYPKMSKAQQFFVVDAFLSQSE